MVVVVMMVVAQMTAIAIEPGGVFREGAGWHGYRAEGCNQGEEDWFVHMVLLGRFGVVALVVGICVVGVVVFCCRGML